MRISFRDGFYGGLATALLLGLFLIWLWRPEHQLQLHSRNLMHAIEKKNWKRFGEFIAPDYHDQWGHDHALLLERTSQVFQYVRSVELIPGVPEIWTTDQSGFWKANVKIEGDDSEITGMIKERVNSLSSPFRLEWHKMSAKPWDWKLVGVTNPDLVIPEGFQGLSSYAP